jgi:hypothetical protein
MKPEIITQGETYKFSITLSDYSSPEWTASMLFTSADNAYEVTGTSTGTKHDFKITPAVTATYDDGSYRYRISVTDGDDVYTANAGYATVLLDPTVPGNSMSHVEKTLQALNATIEGKATSDILNYSIRGRSVGRMSPEELLSWRDKYMQFFKQEQLEQDIENGLNVQQGVIRVRL